MDRGGLCFSVVHVGEVLLVLHIAHLEVFCACVAYLPFRVVPPIFTRRSRAPGLSANCSIVRVLNELFKKTLT